MIVSLPALAPALWIACSILARPALATELPRDFGFATRKLEARGAAPDFLRLLTRKADREIQEKVIRTNVLGFRLKPNYSGHIDEKAIRKCRAFLDANSGVFAQAEKHHGVPKEVIAALLWVETRHGKNTGRFAVPSVYLNLAMADHPAMVERTLEALKEEVPATDPQYPELEAKVRERSKLKAEWAVTELMALQEMRARRLADPFRIKGSYAGAFGMAQFIPSSYVKWAEGRNARTGSDLFVARDAIHSVGNFLSQHGWGAEEPMMKQSLRSYNKSDAYVSTILALAGLIRPGTRVDRQIAAQAAAVPAPVAAELRPNR